MSDDNLGPFTTPGFVYLSHERVGGEVKKKKKKRKRRRRRRKGRERAKCVMKGGHESERIIRSLVSTDELLALLTVAFLKLCWWQANRDNLRRCPWRPSSTDGPNEVGTSFRVLSTWLALPLPQLKCGPLSSQPRAVILSHCPFSL